MAVQKQDVIKDFSELGEAMHQQQEQQHVQQHVRQQEQQEQQEQKVETLNTKVLDFIIRISPSDDIGETLQWVCALARTNYEELVQESNKDPDGMIEFLAIEQGKANHRVVEKMKRSEAMINSLMDEKESIQKQLDESRQATGELKRDLDKFKAQMLEIASERLGRDNKVETKVETIEPPDFFQETKRTFQSASHNRSRLIPGVKNLPVNNPPSIVKIQVEEPSMWETAGKAVVTGVVVAATVYATYKALDYFFGDDDSVQ